MEEMRWIAWLFPLLFIFHDMEEIIYSKKWVKQGHKKQIKFPLEPFGNTEKTAGFALAVYEEFILFMVVTGVSCLREWYGLWYGLFAAVILHLIIMHILLGTIGYHCYVPGVVTAVITLIPSCYLLYRATELLSYSIIQAIIWTVIGGVISVANMKLLHKYMGKLNQMVA